MPWVLTEMADQVERSSQVERLEKIHMRRNAKTYQVCTKATTEARSRRCRRTCGDPRIRREKHWGDSRRSRGGWVGRTSLPRVGGWERASDIVATVRTARAPTSDPRPYREENRGRPAFITTP